MEPHTKQQATLISVDSELGAKLHANWQKNIDAIPQSSQLWSALANIRAPLAAERLCRISENDYGILLNTKAEPQLQLLSEAHNLDLRFSDYLLAIQENYPVFFIGCGIGEGFEAVQTVLKKYSKRDNIKNFFQRLFFIEKEPILFHASLYFFDLTLILPLIYDRIFCGSSWTDISHEKINRNIASIFSIPTGNHEHVNHFIHNLILSRFGSVHILPGVTNSGFNAERKLIGPQYSSDNRDLFNLNLSILSGYNHFYIKNSYMETIRLNEISVDISSEKKLFTDLSLISDTYEKEFSISPTSSFVSSIKRHIEKNNNFDTTWLLLGSDDGTILQLLYQSTIFKGQWEGHKNIIYLLEPSLDLFTIFLHFVDLEKLLKDSRIFFFIGDNCILDLLDFLKNDTQSPIPNRYLLSNYHLTDMLNDISTKIDSYNKILEKETNNNKSIISKYYNSKTIEYWKKHFNVNRKLNIAALTTRMSSFVQYCTSDLLDGFKENGHNVKLIIEKDHDSRLRPNIVLKSLLDYKPDLLIIIDHLRGEFPWLPLNIPYMCWIQDMLPAFEFDNNLKANNLEFIFCISNIWKSHLSQRKQLYSKKIHHLPIGVNSKRYTNKIYLKSMMPPM